MNKPWTDDTPGVVRQKLQRLDDYRNGLDQLIEKASRNQLPDYPIDRKKMESVDASQFVKTIEESRQSIRRISPQHLAQLAVAFRSSVVFSQTYKYDPAVFAKKLDEQLRGYVDLLLGSLPVLRKDLQFIRRSNIDGIDVEIADIRSDLLQAMKKDFDEHRGPDRYRFEPQINDYSYDRTQVGHIAFLWTQLGKLLFRTVDQLESELVDQLGIAERQSSAPTIRKKASTPTNAGKRNLRIFKMSLESPGIADAGLAAKASFDPEIVKLGYKKNVTFQTVKDAKKMARDRGWNRNTLLPDEEPKQKDF